MFNVTVIKGRDVLKYIAQITIIIVCLLLFKSVLNKSSLNLKLNWSKLIDEKKSEMLLKQNIPLISEVKKENENIEDKITKTNPLKDIIENELKIAKHVIKNEEKEINEKNNLKKDEENKQENSAVQHAKTGLTTTVIQNNVPNKFTNSYHGVQVKNETDYNLTEEMLTSNISVNNQNIIIFHTHTCESYTPTEQYNYEQTGTYRTTDLNYSVARVGTELTNQLISYNYKVIHDTTYHDWPAYSGSYGRSLETVKKILKGNADTDVVIDLHRDAIGDYSYAPTVKIGEEEAAQLMFVIGTDGGGLEHPNWNQNLKFAVKLQEKANEMYPGLFKPIILRNSRYNQHLAKGACIIEVGATGNTMEQCLNSMKYLAKVMSEIMK